MEKFILKPESDYIQLNDLMKFLNWVGSGGEAKHIILQENVLVNGSPELRIRRKLRAGDKVSFNGHVVEICES